MSLHGRRAIDRLKQQIGKFVTLPCPPYGRPEYWNSVYKSLGQDEVYEWWGSLSFHDLAEHRYRTIDNGKSPSYGTATLRGVLGIEENASNKTVLLLGCGNSRFGEDFLRAGFCGPLIQVDVAASVVDSMSARCSTWIDNGAMEIIEDDATQLSAIHGDSIAATIDKGLVDALFCANEFIQINNVLHNVHRVTNPGGVFCILSFSQPEFLLPKLSGNLDSEPWAQIEVRELDSILMYLCKKQNTTPARKLRQKAWKHRAKVN